MTKKEEFIIKIMLQKMELTESESIALIETFNEYRLPYDRIIKRKMNIYPLIKYLKKRGYPNDHMNKIIATAIKKYSSKKIININEVLVNNNYTNQEIQKIEKNKEIFTQSIDTLQNKINYFDDNNLRELTIINSKGLIISLKLVHARIQLFKRKRISLNKENIKLFESDDRFKYDFGITSNDLREMYPLPEKYLIK